MIDVRCPLCKNRYSCMQMGMIPLENCGMFVIDDTIKRHKTNADRIRAMTDEELAGLLEMIPHSGNPPTYTIDGFCIDDGLRTKRQWLDWLRQEAQT